MPRYNEMAWASVIRWKSNIRPKSTVTPYVGCVEARKCVIRVFRAAQPRTLAKTSTVEDPVDA